MQQRNGGTPRPRVGISSCLVGRAVRYDGGDKLAPSLVEALSEHVELVPVCPEVGIGMGVPRPPIHLVEDAHGRRAVQVDDRERDFTRALTDYAYKIDETEGLSGYVLKSKSPSCGLGSTPIENLSKGHVIYGSGIYAGTLRRRSEWLPMAEEQALDTPARREHFLEQVFGLRRWREWVMPRLDPESLVDFHARHKYQLLAHDADGYKELGRLVASAGVQPLALVLNGYLRRFMAVLACPATRARHVNALQHVAGHFKDRASAEERAAVAAAIEAFRNGEVGLDQPMARLRRLQAEHRDPYIERQTYVGSMVSVADADSPDSA